MNIKRLIFITALFVLTGCSSSSSSFSSDYEEDWVCSYNYYNCDDFRTHREAQRAYEYCGGDIHELDRDKDGLACETLP